MQLENLKRFVIQHFVSKLL